MMNLLDAFVLARTKLRSHRIRTAITIVMAGLFFGLIIGALFFIQGILTSVDKYSGVGLNDRILVNISRSSMGSYFDPYSMQADEEFIREVEAAHAAYIVKKQATAKKYSVPYDPLIEDPSPIVIDPITKQKMISFESIGSALVDQVYRDRQNAQAKPFSLEQYLKEYESVTLRGTMNEVQPANGLLTFMKDGKETAVDITKPRMYAEPNEDGGGRLVVLDGSVTKPFISSDAFDPSKGEVPVILPFSHAEKMLGLTKLSAEASPEERRERLRYVRDNVGSIAASFCYRSNASQYLLTQAATQHDMIKRQSSEPGFVMPALLYNEPNTTDCVGVTVKSDTRSASEKVAEENRTLFDKEMGVWIGEASERKVVVRGVGVSGDVDTATTAFSPVSLVLSLLNSNLGYETWAIPSDLFEKLPEDARPDEIFKRVDMSDVQYDPYSYYPETYLVEFTDKEEARDLLNKSRSYSGGENEVYSYSFGSGVLFIDDLRTWTEKILFWVLIVVGTLAAITLWAVIGRTIADSRRESAVFRAIGATRLDIASIYGLYAFLLTLRVALFAFVLGLSVSLAVDIIYTERMTVAAEVAYATADTGIEFHLFGLFSRYVAIVLGVIVLTGMLASIVPILLGVRRNPITDMRDEG